LDVAALSTGVVSMGVVSGAGVATGYSAKVAVDRAMDKIGNPRAKARAQRAIELYKKHEFQEGVDVLTAALDVHQAKTKKNRNKELASTVDAQNKAFDAFVKRKAAAAAKAASWEGRSNRDKAVSPP
jgi:hypothetical protein